MVSLYLCYVRRKSQWIESLQKNESSEVKILCGEQNIRVNIANSTCGLRRKLDYCGKTNNNQQIICFGIMCLGLWRYVTMRCLFTDIFTFIASTCVTGLV